ncbi:hypothetical protein D3C71_1673470 [compost metagenome]
MQRTTTVVAPQASPATTPKASPSNVRPSICSNDMPPANAMAIPPNASRIPSHCNRRRRSLGSMKCSPNAVNTGAV